MTVECFACGEEFDDVSDMEEIETPNYKFNLCLECAVEAEEAMYERLKEITESE